MVLLCLTPALAQGTGTLRGRVTGRDGSPMPGAVISLKSATNSSANALGTVTDAKGEFRIPSLPPADDYQLTAAFPGMATVTQGPIQVQSDTVTRVDFVLVQELVTHIRVEAQGSIVDTTTATTRTVVNEEFLSTLPILGRNYSDLLTLAPGVTDTDGDGKPNVHGAREVDFQTRLDGFNVTDPFGGEDPSGINIEAIQEILVITTGANAEYGRAQGGVASVTTKSGGNDFEGSFKVFYQTRSLDGDGARNQDAVVVDIPPPSFRTLKPFLTVGGALRRDRAWYFLANQYIDQQEPINIIGITRNQTIEGWNEFGKLTWQINPSHKAVLSALYDPRETTGNNLGIGISPVSDLRIERRTPVVSAQHTWVATSTILLESAVSLLDGRQKVRPWNADEQRAMEPSLLTLPCPDLELSKLELWSLTCARLPDFTYTQKLETGQIDGPWWFDQDSDSSRLTAKQDLSFYVDDLLGSHQLKVGYELGFEDYSTTVEQRPLRYEFEGTRGRPLFLWADFEERVQDAEASGDTLAVYLQDSWRILPNLTLNLGVRVDREELKAPGQTFFDPAAERVAFNDLASQVYRPKGDGTLPDSPFWTESGAFFNGCDGDECLMGAPPGSRPCDVAGPDLGPPDGFCDHWDRIAVSRIFTRHEAERAPSPFFTRFESPFFIPPCDSPERLGTCRGEEEINLKNTNLAPRLSISYDPFGDGKTKLWATYGRFYDRLFLATIIPEQARDFTYISLESKDRGLTFEGPAQRNFQIYQVSRELRTPFTDEITLGIERELTPEFSISVRYIERKGRDQIQTRDVNHFFIDDNFDGQPDDNFVNDDPGGEQVPLPDTFPDLYPLNPFFGGIFMLDNVNRSEFRGLEINLVKRLHRNWQFDASYSYSEALGNAEAFEDFFLGGDTSQVQHEFGFLDFDQRHVVKFSAVAHFPKRLIFGGRITWESGLPFSLIRRGFTFDNQANPTFRQIFPTRQRNDQRNEGRWLIDVNLRKDFELGRANAGVEFTVTNLLNSDDLEVGNINDFFQSFQLVDETQRRFGRRFQIGFTMNF